MGKVLKITQPNGVNNIAPLSNKAFWLSHNKRLPDGKKVTIVEIDEKDAANTPYIDKDFVAPADAKQKLNALQNESKNKDAEIEELKAKLAAYEAAKKETSKKIKDAAQE